MTEPMTAAEARREASSLEQDAHHLENSPEWRGIKLSVAATLRAYADMLEREAERPAIEAAERERLAKAAEAMDYFVGISDYSGQFCTTPLGEWIRTE